MKKKVIIIILAIFLIIPFYTLTVSVFAEDASPSPSPSASSSPEDVVSEYENVKKEIERLQSQLSDTQTKERTLNNQISYYNNQVSLTILQIEQTRREVLQLKAEVDILESQINGLEVTLERISNTLSERAVESYQRGKLTPLKLLVASNGFDTFVTRYAYLSYIQDHDKKMLFEVQNNQDNVNDKKVELVKKQAEVEEKNKQLERLKVNLSSQKAAKENLLVLTKNDESNYKKLLESAQSKESQLARLVYKDSGKVGYSMSIYSLAKSGSVSAGTRIGTMGNSGYPRCTTASHLHFEVVQGGDLSSSQISGDLISGFAFLQSRQVSFFQANNTLDVGNRGAGSWQWPMSNPIITQEFGKTPWSSRYLSGFHTGIDMVDYNDRAVKAPASGTLYYAKIACGSPINIAIIDHGSGTYSTYLHLE